MFKGLKSKFKSFLLTPLLFVSGLVGGNSVSAQSSFPGGVDYTVSTSVQQDVRFQAGSTRFDAAAQQAAQDVFGPRFAGFPDGQDAEIMRLQRTNAQIGAWISSPKCRAMVRAVQDEMIAAWNVAHNLPSNSGAYGSDAANTKKMDEIRRLIQLQHFSEVMEQCPTIVTQDSTSGEFVISTVNQRLLDVQEGRITDRTSTSTVDGRLALTLADSTVSPTPAAESSDQVWARVLGQPVCRSMSAGEISEVDQANYEMWGRIISGLNQGRRNRIMGPELEFRAMTLEDDQDAFGFVLGEVVRRKKISPFGVEQRMVDRMDALNYVLGQPTGMRYWALEELKEALNSPGYQEKYARYLADFLRDSPLESPEWAAWKNTAACTMVKCPFLQECFDPRKPRHETYVELHFLNYMLDLELAQYTTRGSSCPPVQEGDVTRLLDQRANPHLSPVYRSMQQRNTVPAAVRDSVQAGGAVAPIRVTSSDILLAAPMDDTTGFVPSMSGRAAPRQTVIQDNVAPSSGNRQSRRSGGRGTQQAQPSGVVKGLLYSARKAPFMRMRSY